MDKTFVSIVSAVLVIGGLLVFQATRSGTSTVLLPSALAAQPADSVLARIRVVGRVADAPINYKVEPKIVLSFTVEDPGSGSGKVQVVYNGLRPDMFAVGRDVIMDGEYSSGKLIAHKLVTQCPSKYEPPSVESTYERGTSK